MSRKNAYLIKQEIDRRAAQEASRKTFEQYMTDCAAIALNRKGWGEKRVREFLDEWNTVYNEFFDALLTKPESDYYRAKLDESLLPLCKTKPLKPFKDRYEFLPDLRY